MPPDPPMHRDGLEMRLIESMTLSGKEGQRERTQSRRYLGRNAGALPSALPTDAIDLYGTICSMPGPTAEETTEIWWSRARCTTFTTVETPLRPPAYCGFSGNSWT
jgi:hypothetical protein